MITLIEFAWLVGIGSVAVALWVLALISERLGRVLNKPKHHRGLILAAVILTSAGLGRLLGLTDNPAIYKGLIALGLLIATGVTYYYWGWLLQDRGERTAPPSSAPSSHSVGD